MRLWCPFVQGRPLCRFLLYVPVLAYTVQKMNALQATIHCVLPYPPIGQKHGKLAKDGMTTHVPGNHSRRGVLHKSDPVLTR